MIHRQIVCCLVFTTTLLTGVGGATADAPNDKAGSEAKEHLNRGLRLVESADYAAALTELKRANELEPSRLVLYHIAMTYASMGNPVEAEDALDSVLSDTGPLKREYLVRARTAKREQHDRVGLIDVKVNVPASIDIDDVHKGDAPLSKPLRVAAGDHEIAVKAPGYLTAKQTTTVTGQGRSDLVFDLQVDKAKLARVTVASPLLGGEVRVDDEVVGQTPLAAPLSLLPGKHSIGFRRPGYMTGDRQVNLAPSTYITVAFDPDEDKSDTVQRGRLVVTDGEGSIRVTIDARARGVYHKPISLPIGSHVVTLDRADFEPLERTVEIGADTDTEVSASLRPGKHILANQADRTNRVKSWGTVAIVTGAVVAAGSIGLIVWGQSQLPAAEDKLQLVQKDAVSGGGGGCDPTHINQVTQPICNASMMAAEDTVSKYRDIRLGGIIGTSAGAILIGVGVALHLMSPAAEQPKPRPSHWRPGSW